MKKRFIGELMAGVIAAGATEDVGVVEKVGEVGMDVGAGLVPARAEANEGTQKEKQYQIEHPIEAELMEHGVTRASVDSAMKFAADLVKENRYHDEVQEKRYFAVCRDEVRWKSIKKSIAFASEKTGVPERVLLAIGLIESQFQDDVHRDDTDVHGAFQMTLATAKEAARDAEEVFGFPIEVKSAKDLEETKTSARLAALRLRQLTKRYGQMNLAIAAYCGREDHLKDRLREVDPKLDFGDADWKEMERTHEKQITTMKSYKRLLTLVKMGRANKDQEREMLKIYHAFSEAVEAYKKAKASWRKKREAIPEALQRSSMTIISLFERARQKNSADIPHAITYPLALDDIASRAEIYAKRPLKNIETDVNVSVVK